MKQQGKTLGAVSTASTVWRRRPLRHHLQAACLPHVCFAVAAKVPLVAEGREPRAKLDGSLLAARCPWQSQGGQQEAQEALVPNTCIPQHKHKHTHPLP